MKYFLISKDEPSGKWQMCLEVTGTFKPKYLDLSKEDPAVRRHKETILHFDVYFNSKEEAELCLKFKKRDYPNKTYMVVEGEVSRQYKIPELNKLNNT